jgi:D-arabinose 1-dehydrogenase-like Zn-dependent alcohol dehydrogenase
MPGLTAWQGLFEHGRVHAGQSVLVHGAAGVVGSMVSQLAREAGAYVIGTGRAGARQTTLDFGAQEQSIKATVISQSAVTLHRVAAFCLAPRYHSLNSPACSCVSITLPDSS